MMKILQINNVYPDGSTGKITADIHHLLLLRGCQSYVCYGRGPRVSEENVTKICSEAYAKCNVLESEITGVPYGGCLLSTARLLRIIRKLKPDVVHLQCINEHFVNIYRLVAWLNRQRIPTVVTLHAEFLYTGNCGHAFECEKWKTGCGDCPRPRAATRSLWFDRTHENFLHMQAAFSGFDSLLRIVAVSPWIESRAKMSPILRDKQYSVIYNGLNTDVFCYRECHRKELFPGCAGQKVILHVTAFFSDREDDPKGGSYIIRLARQWQEQNILVAVAGRYKISSDNIPSNLVFLGAVTDQTKLARYYCAADLTVIASKRESYSMVCAESLCCGTPVVGFQAGAPETISLPGYSEFIPYGDCAGLQRCAEKWLRKAETLDKKEIARAAAHMYSREKMIDQYEALYRELLDSKRKRMDTSGVI